MSRITTGRHRIRNAASASSASDAGHDQRDPEVVDAVLDVRRRPEDGRVELIPARPGCISLRASSTSAASRRACLRPGDFSMTSIRPGPLGVSASPISGWMVLDHRRDVAEAQSFVPSSVTRTERLRRRDGRDVLDAEPLVGRVDEAARAGRRRFEERQRRDPEGVTGRVDDLVQRHVCCGQLRRIDLHLQLPVALAPDGHVGDAGHAEQAGDDRPASEHRHLDRRQRLRTTPTISTRLVDDSGWSICGGFETFGSACACVMRSATNCRAREQVGARARRSGRSGRGPEPTRERMSLRNGMPLSRSCSIGTVISCSTSAADSPSASVCTSTVTGANSGQHVHGHRAELRDADDECQCGERDDEQPELHAPRDDPVGHRGHLAHAARNWSRGSPFFTRLVSPGLPVPLTIPSLPRFLTPQ